MQRYHQHVDAACERIYVGHLQRRPDGDDLPFAFVDDDPKADARERAKALKPGDWVRIWSPGRRRLLACGTVRPRSQRSQDGVVSDAADIDVPLLWFDGSCPAEWATPHRM